MTTMTPHWKSTLHLALLGALTVVVCLSLLVVGFPQARGQTAALNDDEAAVLALINAYREDNGLSTLKVSPTLSAAARWMSEDMAAGGYQGDHIDSLGRNPRERMVDFGYAPNLWGEIIAWGQDTPEEVFQAWRSSPGHNQVMLTAGFKVAGVGQAYNSQSAYHWFWTVDFGDRDDSVPGSPTPTRTSTPTPSPTPSPTPTASPTPPPTQSTTPTPAPGQMVGCPAAGRWSLAVWSGGDDRPTGEALATCPGVPVEAAYWLDPETQGWLRYFAGHPDFNSLSTLDNLQAILALGAQPAP